MSAQLTKSPVLDLGTIAQSTNRAVSVTEDPRTRRFGYNPGLRVMEAVHPRESGRQQRNIPAGVLVAFETVTNMKVQKFNVDKEDKTGPEEFRDLTAAEAFRNVAAIYSADPDTGFRELTPLRPLGNPEAVQWFSRVHPPLKDQNGESTCMYGLDVCVTCRKASLESMKRDRLVEILLDGVNACIANFETMWRMWDGEIMKRKNKEPGISQLEEGHLNVMYQLHETHPDERQAQVAASYGAEAARGTAEMIGTIMAENREENAKMLDAIMQRGGESAELKELREKFDRQQKQLDQILNEKTGEKKK